MVRYCYASFAGLCCAFVAAGAIAATSPSAPQNPADEPAISSRSTDGVWTDHIIVKLRAGAGIDRLRAALKAGSAGSAPLDAFGAMDVRPAIDPPPRDAKRAAKFGLDRFVMVSVAPGTDAVRLAAAVGEMRDLIESAEPDPVGLFHSVPADPLFGSQWALNNEGQTVSGSVGRRDADIDWIEAWQLPHPSAPVVIALLDTGMSASHPDLTGQSVPGRCFVCPVGSESNTDDVLTLSHGTLCSGIMVARNDNSIGVTGVAPMMKVMPLKISTGIAISQTTAGNALIWAADHGASIASMSWSFGATSNVGLLRAGVDYALDAGLLLVASTGNTPHVDIGFPARWPDVIAVGATTSADQLWSGTTTGPEMDLVAPGDRIFTTVDQSSNLNGYTDATGTSMAAPMVAAVASLVWGTNPGLTAADVRFLIENSVDDLGAPGRDTTFGLGRLNAGRALAASLATLPTCAPDYNEDGVADIGDLFAFLSLYFSSFGLTGPGLRADFDHNGMISVDDLFSFMAAWFAGC